MTNAQAIFDSLVGHADVMNLLGKQEDIFLDFKERWSSSDKMTDDERRIFSKAASGFAHQEGGVVVWGIEARKDSNGVDQATTLKPFERVKQFKQALEDYVKYSTDPVVDGILHRPVFLNDDEALDEGFVISYFPKSSRVHRALGNTTADFYKRHGDSFTPLSTEEVKGLFLRTLAPDLEFVVVKGHEGPRPAGITKSYNRTFGLRNGGSGVAKSVALYLGLAEQAGIHNIVWFDGEGNQHYHLGKLITAPNYEKRGQLFVLRGDCPNLSRPGFDAVRLLLRDGESGSSSADSIQSFCRKHDSKGGDRLGFHGQNGFGRGDR